jgi:hypothetical protein
MQRLAEVSMSAPLNPIEPPHRTPRIRACRAGSKPSGNYSVYGRIAAIIGVHLTRSDLIAVVHSLGLVPLGRDERRIKAMLIQKLEDARDTLLPLLDTPHAIASLKRAYGTLSLRNGRTASTRHERAREELPPEATVEFYLNRPRAPTPRILPHCSESEWRSSLWGQD